jgi:hypothetical protein
VIEVRIRHFTEDKSVHLCMWPATDLGSLMPTLNGWGLLHTRTTEESSSLDNELSGSFVVDPQAGYFELVLGTDDDD